MSKKTEQVRISSYLTNRLNKFDGILNNNIINYLNDLIKLDKSSLDENIISSRELDALSELKLYRDIVKYNLYYKIYNFTLANYPNLTIKENEYDINGLHVYYDNKTEYNSIIRFDCYKDLLKLKYYLLLEDKNAREEEINKLYKELESVDNEVNPFTQDYEVDEWNYNHQRKIDNLMDKISLLDERCEFPLAYKNVNNLQMDYLNSLFNDLKLDMNDGYTLKRHEELKDTFVKKNNILQIVKKITRY